MPPFERHVFVCHNVRPADAPRPSCTTDGTSALHSRLQQLSRDAGLGGKVRINKSGCLDQCEHGPTVVVDPAAVWYGHVKPEDAEEIVAEHLVGGRPVERLRLADGCVNTKTARIAVDRGRTLRRTRRNRKSGWPMLRFVAAERRRACICQSAAPDFKRVEAGAALLSRHQFDLLDVVCTMWIWVLPSYSDGVDMMVTTTES